VEIAKPAVPDLPGLAAPTEDALTDAKTAPVAQVAPAVQQVDLPTVHAVVPALPG